MTIETWFSVLSFVVSLVGGVLGVYVGYRLVEYRVSELEKRVDGQGQEIDRNRRESDDKLGKIAADVSYIRGKMENS